MDDQTRAPRGGYVSRLDGSVQPYGLVVPASLPTRRHQKISARFLVPWPRRHIERTDFISDREKNVEFTLRRTCIVLHPYGRYCNAYKFAGEVDVFEALDRCDGIIRST